MNDCNETADAPTKLSSFPNLGIVSPMKMAISAMIPLKRQRFQLNAAIQYCYRNPRSQKLLTVGHIEEVLHHEIHWIDQNEERGKNVKSHEYVD